MSTYPYPLTWEPEIEKEGGQPVYRAIADTLQRDIAAGALKPGDRLPAQRELADFLGVNLTTVTKAFRLGIDRGLLEAAVGRGTYVAARREEEPLPATREDNTGGREGLGLIDLGMIHPLYGQNRLIAETVKQVSQRIGIERYFEYDEPRQARTHRQAGAQWLRRAGFDTDEESIMVASGSQNALAVTLMSLFHSGDSIGADRLTYTGFRNLAEMLGIRLIPVDGDGEGMDPEELARLCRSEGLKGVYLMPECQNPTARTLSEERRRSLASVVERQDLILLEDDHYSFLGNTGLPPVSAYIPERSVYIAGTSKSLGPGLRISYMRVAPAFRPAVGRGIYNVNLTTSHFNSEVAASLIESGAADRIIALKQAEAESRSLLADELLGGWQVMGNQRDYFRFLTLPAGWTGREFERAAAAAGVQVNSGEKFVIGNRPAPAAVRISLSAARDRKELGQGLKILRSLLERGPESGPLFV